MTNKVRTLFDDADARKTDVFRLSDFNSHFGNPNADAPKTLEITLVDGRVFFFDEDEECAVPHGKPKLDNVSHLRWQRFSDEDVMSEDELKSVLRDAGITYDPKYRVCDKNPVEAIHFFCKASRKVFRCPWYNFVDHDDWQWRCSVNCDSLFVFGKSKCRMCLRAATMAECRQALLGATAADQSRSRAVSGWL